MEQELFQRVENGDLQVFDLLKFLIENGVNVNCKNDYGDTPLIVATAGGNFEMVKLLVTVGGADVNFIPDNLLGYTPLIWASIRCNFEIVKFLVEDCGVDINFQDKHNTSAIFWATYRGHLEIAKLLVENGAEIYFTCFTTSEKLNNYLTSLKIHS